ncbi:MAG: TraR/DksA C4-type zinc finger protein [Gammaproteobacteria bacterium]|nr:TraR/DksA C4-type zinc finger protein [Gammaproteobacteria bacterium]
MKQVLDDKQRNALLKKMQDRYAVLHEEVRAGLAASDNEDYRKLAGEVADSGEEALADLLVDVRLAEIDRDLEEINDINAATARMRSGTYGICSDCGAPVPYARLQAYPTAKRCEPCQRRHERTFRTPGAPTL